MELVLLIIVRVVCSGALDPGAPGVGTRLSAGSREDIFCNVRQRCSVLFSWIFFFHGILLFKGGEYFLYASTISHPGRWASYVKRMSGVVSSFVCNSRKFLGFVLVWIV